MSTHHDRLTSLIAVLAAITLTYGFASSCSESMGMSDSGGAGGLANQSEEGGPWATDTTYSPTGTTLVPVDSGSGYEVVDEICGAIDDLAYAQRFLTPMFRDMVIDGETAYVVDGSHLWVLDTGAGLCSERRAIDPLIGQPISVHLTDSRLWVAAVEGGLVGYALGADGLVDPDDVEVALSLPDVRVMDVTGIGNVLFAALGRDGMAVITLDENERVADVTLVPAGPYANTVSVDGTRVLVAACDRVWSYRIDDLTTLDPTMVLSREADFAVPFGKAKGVTGSDDIVWVSVGEALQGFRLGETTSYLGFYTDDAPGFYVNEAVVAGGFLYLAAGDQSVRAVEIGDLTLEEGVPVTWDEPGTTTDGPIQMDLEDAMVTTFTETRDPISVEVDGDRLYALGNFRYVGERTVEVFDISIPAWLRHVCSYVQPNHGIGISQMGGEIVVHGADGQQQVVAIVSDQPVAGGSFSYEPTLKGTLSEGSDLYLYGAGSVVRASQGGGNVSIEDLVPAAVDAQGLALTETHAFISDGFTDSILVMELDQRRLLGVVSAKDGFLGDAELLAMGDRLIAYDRVLGDIRVFDTGGESLPVELGRTYVGLCEAYKLADFYSGAVNAKATFVPHGDQLHMVCPRRPDGTAALVRIEVSEDGTPSVAGNTALPSVVFADATVAGDALVLASFDNNRYASTLLSCDLETGEIRHETEFMGHVNAVLHAANRLFVMDGDFGLRVFDTELQADLVEPLPF